MLASQTDARDVEVKHLAKQHERLARELYLEATSAQRDANFHVSDCLIEQADLHTVTAVALADLLDELLALGA